MFQNAHTSRRTFLAATAATAAGIAVSHQSTMDADAKAPGLPGISTGFENLDCLTGGLHRSEMVLLASRPGVGKTGFALNISDFVSAVACVPTLYVSLGTSRVSLAQRLLCSRGDVPHEAMRNRTLSPDHWRQVTQAAWEIRKGPLYLYDQPLRTVAHIEKVCQRLDRRLGPKEHLGFLVVDHLERVDSECPGQNLGEHLIGVSYGLRDLARSMNLAVLCLLRLGCQKSVSDNPPALGKLRGTQFAADVVMLLHRPDSNLAPSEAQTDGHEGKAQLSVIRRRDRLAGTVELSWNNQYLRFS